MININTFRPGKSSSLISGDIQEETLPCENQHDFKYTDGLIQSVVHLTRK